MSEAGVWVDSFAGGAAVGYSASHGQEVLIYLQADKEGSMAEADQILAAASSILLVDWPSRDVPDTLTRAGYQVFVKGGPGPADFSAYEVRGGEVVSAPTGRAPEHADVVYCHRPVGELPQIVALARQVGATALWHQSGLSGEGQRDPRGCWLPETDSGEARTIVEAAGLTYLHEPYIADVARRITSDPGKPS